MTATKREQIELAYNDLVTTFEFELSNAIKTQSDEPTEDGEYEERRLALRQKFIEQFASLPQQFDRGGSGDAPKYDVIFDDLLSELYNQQMSGSRITVLFKERVKAVNQRNGLPQKHWDVFDEKDFNRYLKNLGLLNLLNQLVNIFDLDEFRPQIMLSELERLQAKGTRK